MQERFGDYHLITKIATGGMAEIFLAKHVNSPVTSMPIAIKRILRQHNTNHAFIKMFLAEARIICNLTHDRIVKIYDFGKYDDIYYIAMEYVFGQNLGQLMNRYEQKGKRLPLDLVLNIAAAVLEGLDFAHNARDRNGMFLNIVHLDMNPNNILLSYEGKIKLVDFGIAHASYTSSLKRSLLSIQGTYGYLSPEQCLEQPVDRRSDIFSLGVILYEALSGKPLFKHMESDAAILHAIVHEPIPDIRTVAPEVPREVAAILRKALQKDRNARYSSAAEMLEDIKKFRIMREFDPQTENIPAILKREFASHFIKMTQVIEKAQAAYMMDELFKDIGELEGIDLNEKIRFPEEESASFSRQQIEEEKEKEKEEKRRTLKSWLLALTIGLAALIIFFVGLGVYLFYPFKQETVEVFVSTLPPGAEIFVDGKESGVYTPATLNLFKDRSYIFGFRKGDLVGEVVFTPGNVPEKNKVFVKLGKQEH